MGNPHFPMGNYAHFERKWLIFMCHDFEKRLKIEFPKRKLWFPIGKLPFPKPKTHKRKEI